ncbi:MAG TPA: hypothetical protein VMU67_17785 [Steroidobacteraceae bacterium]|nr:hypothetical protein [Steroidobacteraceae bacterium]
MNFKLNAQSPDLVASIHDAIRLQTDRPADAFREIATERLRIAAQRALLRALPRIHQRGVISAAQHHAQRKPHASRSSRKARRGDRLAPEQQNKGLQLIAEPPPLLAAVEQQRA